MSDTETPDPDSIDFDDDGVTVQKVLRHRNKDETAVLVTNFGDGWQAIAMDVDAGGQVLDVEIIGSDEDKSTTVGMASYWVDQNPEGAMGGDDGGFMSNLLGGGQ